MIGKKCESPEIFITRALRVTACSNRGNRGRCRGSIRVGIRGNGKIQNVVHLLTIGLEQSGKKRNTFLGFIEIDSILAIRTACIGLVDHGPTNHRLLLRIQAEIRCGAISEYSRTNTLEQAWIFPQQNVYTQLIKLTQAKLVKIKARISGPKLRFDFEQGLQYLGRNSLVFAGKPDMVIELVLPLDHFLRSAFQTTGSRPIQAQAQTTRRTIMCIHDPIEEQLGGECMQRLLGVKLIRELYKVIPGHIRSIRYTPGNRTGIIEQRKLTH